MSHHTNSEEFRKRTKRLLEAFVYDYLKKSGSTETAKTYFEEVGLDNWPPEWLTTLPTKNKTANTTTVRQERNVDKVIKERRKKASSHYNESIGECVNGEDESYEERVEGENTEENRQDTNSKAKNKHDSNDETINSDKFMKATSANEYPNIPLPLDVPDGFLNEWWLIFWDLFSSLRERNIRNNSFE